MNPSNRLIIVLIALMFLPVLITGVIIFTGVWIYLSPAEAASIFSHGIILLSLALVLVYCVILAFIFSHRIMEQLALLTQSAKTMNLDEQFQHVTKHHFYRELQPLYGYIKKHAEFHENTTRIVKEIIRNPATPILSLRSEDDEFVRALNLLITRLQDIQQIITAVAEGNLAIPEPLNATGTSAYTQIYAMIFELSNLVSKARYYTNQIVRTGSQINSVTTQGLQDTKIAAKRINDISQSIQKMAGNIQNVAEHLQGQSFLLDDTSSLIEHTIQSIEEIAGNITHLKAIVEKNTPSSEASEKTSFSLDLIYEATKAIEQDANTCVTLSQEASEDTERGKEVMEHTIASILRVQESMNEFFEIFRRLGDRSEEVSETLEVISDIADRTNLLAINAAIISAHAGEHGRDFAVIANEIGKFAERTQESTSEIEDLLRTIQYEFREAMRAMERSSNAITTSVELSQKAGTTLDKISSSIRSTNEMATGIAASTTDQSRENDRIRHIMEEMVRSQTEKQEQVNSALWQLMQAIAQIRGITSEQAEGSARIAEMAHNLDQITQEIGQATSQHVTTANQIVEAVDYIRKLVQRTTLGTEKAASLTNELFLMAGHLAFTMGEFTLSGNALARQIPDNVPLIGFVRRGSENFFDDMASGIREEARQYGFEILEINSQYEATTQVENVNWLLKQPLLKGIILCPVYPDMARKLVQRGSMQEIPFVAADETIPAAISVRSGNREGGRRAAELLTGHLQPDAAVAVIVDRAVESMVQRALGFRQKAKEYPLDVVEVYCDMTDREVVKTYITSAIEENPELQGIFLTNEGVTTEYLNALHNGILPSDRLIAVGYDRTPLAEEAIRNGELLGAIFQHPEAIGKQAFQYLYKLINKEIQIEDFNEKTIYIPTMQVTRENLMNQDTGIEYKQG